MGIKGGCRWVRSRCLDPYAVVINWCNGIMLGGWWIPMNWPAPFNQLNDGSVSSPILTGQGACLVQNLERKWRIPSVVHMNLVAWNIVYGCCMNWVVPYLSWQLFSSGQWVVCLLLLLSLFYNTYIYGRGLGGSLASCNYSCWSFGVTMATKYVLCQVGFLLCSFRLWRSQDTSEWSGSPITQFLAFTWRIPWQPVVSFVFEGPLLTSLWNALPLPHLGCWGKVDICAWAEEMASQKTQPRPSLIQLNMAPKCVQWARLHLGFKNNNFWD